MSDQKRPYRMKRRAEQEARTRLRITQSAVELHGTLGPARTTFRAVAELAGVPRSTVYRHFPDEVALFGACSAHWLEENPPPDPGPWEAVEDPEERLAALLADLYPYYRRTAAMLDRLLRDAPAVPIVDEMMGAFRGYVDAAADAAARGRGLRGAARKRTRAAIGHAVAFPTWKELAERQGLDDEEAAELMRRLVAAAA